MKEVTITLPLRQALALLAVAMEHREPVNGLFDARNSLAAAIQKALPAYEDASSRVHGPLAYNGAKDSQ
jgi:hypothetical protein